MSRDTFGSYDWEEAGTGIQWVEGNRDAAKYPTMHRTTPYPQQEDYSAQNVNSAEVEKPWFLKLSSFIPNISNISTI